jgi:hypothetical protein
MPILPTACLPRSDHLAQGLPHLGKWTGKYTVRAMKMHGWKRPVLQTQPLIALSLVYSLSTYSRSVATISRFSGEAAIRPPLQLLL